MRHEFALGLAVTLLWSAVGHSQYVLTTTMPGGQFVGGRSLWTVSSATGDVDTRYRFSVGRIGEEPRVVIDYSSENTFEWSTLEEGQFNIRATIRDVHTGAER